MARPKQPERLSEEALAELMRDPPARVPVIEAPKPMRVPAPPPPPSGESELARLKSAGMVSDGTGDAPAWSAPPQRLTIVERDGKVSRFEPGDPIYISVEWASRSADQPWIAQRETSRFGLASIASLTLVELDPEA